MVVGGVVEVVVDVVNVPGGAVRPAQALTPAPSPEVPWGRGEPMLMASSG